VPKGYNSTRSAHILFGRDLASWTGAREVPTWSMINFTGQYHAPQTASAKLVSFIEEQCLGFNRDCAEHVRRSSKNRLLMKEDEDPPGVFLKRS
jgi:hypothetical protein